jgi:hypothetical protein
MKLLSKGKCSLDKTNGFVSIPNLECHQKIAQGSMAKMPIRSFKTMSLIHELNE